MLTGLLQDSLHFTGLVTTDALDMGAIVKTFGADEAVIRAFEAGTDILLMPADPTSAIAAMTKAVERPDLDGATRSLGGQDPRAQGEDGTLPAARGRLGQGA
ncbi:MAG: hypothetical protein IPJ11_15325 [Gemmatimonadetes bacterium]|nr:hypothetical protein [Gemmatimonadota bacterium]